MKWFYDYKEDLSWAFTQVEQKVSAFPAPFDRSALHYLDRFNLIKHEVPTNYICFLLPFWMEHTTELSRQAVRQFTVSNLYGMMYFHLQDAVMDEPNSSGEIWRLPLANLLHMEFIEGYRSFFSYDSTFWSYYRTYLYEWAKAVTEEREQDIFQKNPFLLGHKASLVKLCSTALLILSGKNELIPILEEAVDRVLTLLQMLDDWEDWQKDLADGSYNSLLSMIRTSVALPMEHSLDVEKVKHSLYVGGALTQYYELARTISSKIGDIRDIVPELYEFGHFLLDNLAHGAEAIEAERDLLMQGGLQYWITKNM